MLDLKVSSEKSIHIRVFDINLVQFGQTVLKQHCFGCKLVLVQIVVVKLLKRYEIN
jgi:uncharacterized Zn finger protein (UPF0148 family)